MQKLKENHETIHQVTFQLQQMQEQMNSVSDSGHVQDVNQITVEDCVTCPFNL